MGQVWPCQGMGIRGKKRLVVCWVCIWSLGVSGQAGDPPAALSWAGRAALDGVSPWEVEALPLTPRPWPHRITSQARSPNASPGHRASSSHLSLMRLGKALKQLHRSGNLVLPPGTSSQQRKKSVTMAVREITSLFYKVIK